MIIPSFAPSGPCPAKIAIVGEALGQQEEILGQPFVGGSGQELTRMLAEAGIERKTCYLTNVFHTRPPDNKLDNWCGKKAEVKGTAVEAWEPLARGKYLRPEHAFPQGLDAPSILDRLEAELRAVQPNVVIALGNTACWALASQTAITKIRGTVVESMLIPDLKVLPTYHPAAILRKWDWRATSVADLMKAGRESAFPEIVRPKREVWIDPTLEDLERWEAELHRAPMLAFDIETGHGLITEIGFAPSESLAYVIPFVDQRQPGYSYWPDEAAELMAWQVVQRLLASPATKLAQNGLYDVQYLWRAGCPILNYNEDTMILHHALQPEMEKSLGFLGSVYCDDAAWKLLNDKTVREGKREG